jgi:hypothetical protein
MRARPATPRQVTNGPGASHDQNGRLAHSDAPPSTRLGPACSARRPCSAGRVRSGAGWRPGPRRGTARGRPGVLADAAYRGAAHAWPGGRARSGRGRPGGRRGTAGGRPGGRARRACSIRCGLAPAHRRGARGRPGVLADAPLSRGCPCLARRAWSAPSGRTRSGPRAHRARTRPTARQSRTGPERTRCQRGPRGDGQHAIAVEKSPVLGLNTCRRLLATSAKM